MRRVIQFAESFFAHVFHFLGLTYFIVRLNQWRCRVPVLVYHAVSEIPDWGRRSVDRVGMNIRPLIFEAQIKAFSRWFDIVSMEEFLRRRNNRESGWRRSLVVTFDDGYRNNLDTVVPILERQGAHATFFLLSQHINGVNLSALHSLYQYVDQLRQSGDVDAPERVATPKNRRTIILGAPSAGAQLLERERINPAAFNIEKEFLLAADTPQFTDRGHEIGGHGAGHYLLKSLSPEELKTDLKDCHATISRICETGSKIGFAYPYGMAGTTGPREMNAVNDAGFDYAVTTEERLLREDSELFALPRIQIDEISPSVALFRAAGLRGWLKRPFQAFVWERRLAQSNADL